MNDKSSIIYMRLFHSPAEERRFLNYTGLLKSRSYMLNLLYALLFSAQQKTTLKYWNENETPAHDPVLLGFKLKQNKLSGLLLVWWNCFLNYLYERNSPCNFVILLHLWDQNKQLREVPSYIIYGSPTGPADGLCGFSADTFRTYYNRKERIM